MHRRLRIAAAFMGGILSSTAQAADVSFFDGVFADASYTTVTHATDPSVTIVSGQLAAGGNPGTALQVRFTNSGGTANLLSTQGFLNTSFVYDPGTSGAIAGIDFANDRYVSFGPVLDSPLTTFSRLMVLQGGQYYLATVADPQLRQAWFGTGGTGLSSGDFVGFDFATGTTDALAHPDFSAAGSALTFGLASRFNLSWPVPIDLDGEYRFDNLSVTVHTAPVPEPGTWALMLLGLGALPLVRRAQR